MTNYDELLARGRALLLAHKIDNAPREARLILEIALEKREKEKNQKNAIHYYMYLLQKRCAGMLPSRMRGMREFWSMDFALDDHVLDPRSDSETLIMLAQKLMQEHNIAPRVMLDLGCGTGCLLAALLSLYPAARGLGVDISSHAITCARANWARLGLGGRAHGVCGDWARGIKGSYDIIISNPPYIASKECEHLPPEVRLYDPRLALDGGADGVRRYEALFASMDTCDFRFLLLEVGDADAVTRLAAAHSLQKIDEMRDLGGQMRALVFVRSVKDK